MELKVLQVNAWTGRIKDGLTRFIKDGDFDVVCLQEAIWDEKHTKMLETYIDTVEKIQEHTELKYDFRSPIYGFKMLGGDVEFTQGNVILSKIPIVKTAEETLCGRNKLADSAKDFERAFKNHRCVVQKATLENGVSVFNYHGYWQKDPMGNATTVKYMKRVAKMIKNENGPIIMCGDLNVISRSPAMRELDFLRDLTAANNVRTTLKNIRLELDVACDHILISDEFSCNYFEVVETVLSDHKAIVVKLML